MQGKPRQLLQAPHSLSHTGWLTFQQGRGALNQSLDVNLVDLQRRENDKTDRQLHIQKPLFSNVATTCVLYSSNSYLHIVVRQQSAAAPGMVGQLLANSHTYRQVQHQIGLARL
jgi:hypothetical protein